MIARDGIRDDGEGEACRFDSQKIYHHPTSSRLLDMDLLLFVSNYHLVEQLNGKGLNCYHV